MLSSGVHLYRGDLADEELLKDTIRMYQPKAVLHFAASALVMESMEKPALYYKNNLLGTFFSSQRHERMWSFSSHFL